MSAIGKVQVRRLATFDAAALDHLSEILIDCVDSGASVGFMQPMSHARARLFWEHVARCAARAERIVLVACGPDGDMLGTVQVVLAVPENQPHRAEVAKMLVHRRARNQGVGALLLAAAERTAKSARRSLLVLDTANDVAARLYARQGWSRIGSIPQYALWPAGGYCDTAIFYKKLDVTT